VLLAWSAASAVYIAVAHVRACARANPFEIRMRRFRLALGLSGIAVFSIMAVGLITGGVPTAFHFFSPRDGNPYVVASHAAMAAVWVAVAAWLYLLGGAERLAMPSGRGGDVEPGQQVDAGPWSFLTSSGHIKGVFALCLGAAAVCEVTLWLVDVRLPLP
jgi:hypothetical protein